MNRPLSTVAVHHSRKVGVASSILAVAFFAQPYLLAALMKILGQPEDKGWAKRSFSAERKSSFSLCRKAPPAGFEPATCRLTA